MSLRGLPLPPTAAQRVQTGVRDLPLSLASAEARDLEPGRPIRLLDLKGRELGLALADPENGLIRVLSRPSESFDGFGPAFFARRVESALTLRRKLGLALSDHAYRLVHGAGDALPGFAVDVYGRFGVLHAYSRAFGPQARLLAEALIGIAGLEGVVLKHRSRGAASQGKLKQDVVGSEPDEALVVQERGVPFEVHLGSGLNVGLFTDMREHRHGLARFASGLRVLNGFCYTGSLSLICARAGAATVTSVDLSSGVLAWARDNFSLSGLRPDDERFRFVPDDCSRFLESARGDSSRYDLVLLDPPSFSAARGAPFSIERDYPGLIAKACRVLEPEGLLWLAANTRGVDLGELARAGLASASREAEVLEQGGLPPDHPTLPSQPEDRYLQTLLLRVS